jgi:hypothetical protein
MTDPFIEMRAVQKAHLAGLQAMAKYRDNRSWLKNLFRPLTEGALGKIYDATYRVVYSAEVARLEKKSAS